MGKSDSPARVRWATGFTGVVNRVAASFGVNARDIIHSRDRHEPLASARLVAMAMLAANNPPAKVAAFFSRRAWAVYWARDHADPAHIAAVKRGERIVMRSTGYNAKAKIARCTSGRCLCGNTATRVQFGRWACDRCLRIESNLDQYHRYRPARVVDPLGELTEVAA